ncbi:hypothetical protein ACFSUK_03105 [Sphingobium scionense]|uniref:Uncharacterized protein n=2 Tax=Sphingobium TaxID=165695 RepID=A0A562JU88_SPHWJ|nr:MULTISPECIES: hypothetical protein [Sphingobium]MBB4151119.1 antitoxin component HigA of HigAB toxin-antitoxin module [Sphingobium scionense]MBB6193796.1 antitoxin component HigA of HigAB toxin-antitoxin module [Sphingobium wenxiniae]TWH86726.1 hypothetical protein IQ35_04020 [Sphingobium wenxiniae]
MDKLEPVEAIEAAMEAEGRTRADLAALIGQSRATEVLARKRALTLHMIRTTGGHGMSLHRFWSANINCLVERLAR